MAYVAASSINAKLLRIKNGSGILLGLKTLSKYRVNCSSLSLETMIRLCGLLQNQEHTCAETWNQLRTKAPVVDWWKVIWFSKSIPKHAFICWLAMRNKLTTKDRKLFIYGLSVRQGTWV